MQDINRNGTGTGTPQGFRAASEAQSVGSMGAPECINNTSVLEDGNYMSSAAEITSKSIDGRYSAKLSAVDIFYSLKLCAYLEKEMNYVTFYNTIFL